MDDVLIRVTERPEDLAVFRDLADEYERSLPVDLRHTDFDFIPDVAFVALVDGVPCGCVALSMLEPATAIMKRLFVGSAFRNRGIARALLAAFEAAARERGCTRIVLDTDREQLSAAYALYRSLGFEECEPYGPVDYATSTFMELRLHGDKE